MVKHPAGVLMKPQMREHPPIALGAITLPAQRDLSSLAVNPSAGRAARGAVAWRGVSEGVVREAGVFIARVLYC